MIDKSFYNNAAAMQPPSIFNEKRQSSKTDHFRNSAATAGADRGKRHKSVAHRSKFATRDGVRNPKLDALPSIGNGNKHSGGISINQGIYQNNSSTNIFKKNKNTKYN